MRVLFADGDEAFLEVAQRWSEIPVILTSDDVLPDESSSTANRPLAGQLLKPYRLDDLLDHLQTCRVACVRNPA